APLAGEAARRCRYRERGDRAGRGVAASRAEYRDRHAADALVVLLVIDRVALVADLLEGPPQGRPIHDRSCGVAAQIDALEQRVAARGGKVREQRLACARGVQRRAVPDDGEQADDLWRGHGLDVHGLQVVKDDEVRGLARGLGERAEERSCAKAELPEAGPSLR